jgi:DNA-binding NarL/FixJ family response regulator
MKEQATDELLRAVRSVLSGQVYVSEKVSAMALRRLVEKAAPIQRPQLSMLTGREMHVLKQIGQGKSTREIATSLNLSIKTVETYREHLKYKLGLANSVELVHYAHESLEELTEIVSPIDVSQLPTHSTPTPSVPQQPG